MCHMVKIDVSLCAGSLVIKSKTCGRELLTAGLVLVIGLEPIRSCLHGILSPGCLPIPPHQHVDIFQNTS